MPSSLGLCFLMFLLAAGCRTVPAPERQIAPATNPTANAEPAPVVLLAAFSEGQGPPLVMLGGGVAGAAGFAPHAKGLAGDYRVIRFESLRMERAQCGQPLPADYSIRAESAAMARTLDRLGIAEPVHLVGHSFGALVALDFALDHPDRVRSLVLAEPPAFWVVPPDELHADAGMRAMVNLTRTFGPLEEPTDEQLVQFQSRLGKTDVQPPARGRPGWEDWLARRRALRGLSAVPNHTDDPSRLRSLRRPVLVMTGAKMVAFHRRINDILAASLPDAERAQLDGGHAAPGTNIDAFVAELRALLARHP